jgi:hypothetical protein
MSPPKVLSLQTESIRGELSSNASVFRTAPILTQETRKEQPIYATISFQLRKLPLSLLKTIYMSISQLALKLWSQNCVVVRDLTDDFGGARQAQDHAKNAPRKHMTSQLLPRPFYEPFTILPAQHFSFFATSAPCLSYDSSPPPRKAWHTKTPPRNPAH